MRHPPEEGILSVTPLYGRTFAPGAIVDDFIVNELIAQSGFSVLYRAEHRLDKTPVALKVMRASLLASEKMLIRFRREVDSLRRLNKRAEDSGSVSGMVCGIVTVLAEGELSDGRPFVATEWLAGRNLRDELAVRGPLSTREALAVFSSLAKSLSEAHRIGIVHRDLKAQNIMAVPTRNGWFSPVLLDFGIAKLREPRDGHGQLTTHTQLGTPQTASPEQILGRPIDERADIYALGIILYQLVTGRLPFNASTVIEIEEMHLHKRPPNASEIAAVPTALDRVISRAMAKERGERFPTVAEMLAATERALNDSETHRQLQAVGLFVETKPKNDDQALVAADEMLAAAEQRIRELGLRINAESADSLLAIGVEIAAEDVIKSALSLRAQFRTTPNVELHIAVHSSPVETVGDQIRAGQVLSPSSWPSDSVVD